MQVGHHFSRYGRVMDVVPVKDFGVLLLLAAQATALEKQRTSAGEQLGRHFAREWAGLRRVNTGARTQFAMRVHSVAASPAPAPASTLLHRLVQVRT